MPTFIIHGASLNGYQIRVHDTWDEVPTATHLLMATPALEVLLLRRRGNDFGGYWGMPGGGIDPGEAILPALLRELREEIGVDLQSIPHAVTRLREGPMKGCSKAYFLGVHKFIPELNHEHDAYVWAPITNLPDPTHPNALEVIRHFRQHFKGFNHG